MAILTKAEYLASINSILPDNSTQEISPLDLRTSLINLADSVPSFMVGNELDSTNFSTPDTRTTIGGELALRKIHLAGHSSVDNTAIGYSSLTNNYDGSGNTAVGSYALSCNLYGVSNTAVGHQSLAGNTIGSGNVGLGTFTLNNGKKGNYNIAIGHGAGWYHGMTDEFKLYIGSLPISGADLCDGDGNPLYSGEPPLIYGDLNQPTHRLAIGTNELHSFSILQVSGDITPSTGGSGDFNVGNSQFPWDSINEEIYFSGSYVGIGGQPSGALQNVNAVLTSWGGIVPGTDGSYALGRPGDDTTGKNQLLWDGYFNDVIISGQAFINDATYNNIEECLYECKTLHLATSGFCDPDNLGFDDSSVCGILDDAGLDGAGFEIHSSGAGNSYRRDYRFIYKSPDASIECIPSVGDNAFSRSRWESNISLELVSNATSTPVIISQRTIGRYDTGMAIQSGCMGIFIEPYAMSGQRVVVGQEPQYNDQYPTLTDVNFLARSGTDLITGIPSGYDFTSTYGTVDSGVKVAQKFASRIKQASTARGFRIVYHDSLDQ